jgi:hypothetical protein
MEKLEELKQKIKEQIKANKEGMEFYASKYCFASALEQQHCVSALEMVLGIIAEVEGNEDFF